MRMQHTCLCFDLCWYQFKWIKYKMNVHKMRWKEMYKKSKEQKQILVLSEWLRRRTIIVPPLNADGWSLKAYNTARSDRDIELCNVDCRDWPRPTDHSIIRWLRNKVCFSFFFMLLFRRYKYGLSVYLTIWLCIHLYLFCTFCFR